MSLPPLLVPFFQKLGLNTAYGDASFKLMESSRGVRMKIYSLAHGELGGPVFYAKKADALADARDAANRHAMAVEVTENTIVGPISRELVCNLLNGSGWSSESLTVEIVWPTDKAARKAAREQSARADTIMLGARKAAPAQADGGVA